MSKHDRRTARAIATLDEIYRLVPVIACRRLCGDACGPIILTDLEAHRLRAATHTKPRTLPMITTPADLRCVYLAPDQDRCTVYAIRPLICRVWGVLKRLSCPHGCVPDRWLTDHEFVALAQAVEKIGGGRVLRTSPDGLGHIPGERFAALGPPTGPKSSIDEEAEHVRGLRALFGGRIIAVASRRDAEDEERRDGKGNA